MCLFILFILMCLCLFICLFILCLSVYMVVISDLVDRHDSLRKMTNSQGSLCDELQEVSWYQPGVLRSAFTVSDLLVALFS